MPLLTQRRETQIVALLLLFFLAHFALAEPCQNVGQLDVRYACDLYNINKGSVTHWNNWSDESDACLTPNPADGLFVRETAQILRASDFTPAAEARESTLSETLSKVGEPGDMIAGLMVERKPTILVASGLTPAVFNITIKAFFSKTGQSVSAETPVNELKSVSLPALDDGVVRTVGAPYTDPATQTNLDLQCSIKITAFH